MDRIDKLSGLYDLGRAVSGLETIIGNFRQVSAYQCMMLSSFNIAMLDSVIKDEILPFDQTKRAANTLRDLIDSTLRSKMERQELDQPFTDFEAQHLMVAFGGLTSALRHEMDKMPLFFVTERRAYDVDVLLSFAERILSAKHLSLLAARTVEDIRQAGRCIAFDVPTAAGFHSVRATEAVARGYHDVLTGIRPGQEAPLGTLTNNLRTHRDSMVNAKTIDKEDRLHLVIEMLARVNNIYRKPIAHPDMVLDLPGAITVFDAAKCAIDLMLEDALKKRASPIPDGFF